MSDRTTTFSWTTEGNMRVAMFALLGAVIGCGGADPNSGPAPENFEGPAAPTERDAFVLDAAAYCRAVAQPGLVRWDRDVLTACPAGGATEDVGGACTVRVLAGSSSPVPLADARLALRAAGDAFVFLRADHALVWHEASGRESVIAPWAAEPNVSNDGVRVAFVALAEGVPVPEGGVAEPGTATRIVVRDLRDGTDRTITEDADASAPVVVPASDDVLYVSSRTGLASIWRGNGEYELQVTNVELETGDQGVLPVYGANVVWLPGARTLVFEAASEESTVWSFDVLAGRLEALGPGTWPQIAEDGSVLAAVALASDPQCAVRYLVAEP